MSRTFYLELFSFECCSNWRKRFDVSGTLSINSSGMFLYLFTFYFIKRKVTNITTEVMGSCSFSVNKPINNFAGSLSQYLYINVILGSILCWSIFSSSIYLLAYFEESVHENVIIEICNGRYFLFLISHWFKNDKLP